MNSENLNTLAKTILALTWSEMNEVASPSGFGTGSYSATKPDQMIDWAKKQLKKIDEKAKS